jgi:hypothetical protein
MDGSVLRFSFCIPCSLTIIMATSLFASSRSPKCRANHGHSATQAGSSTASFLLPCQDLLVFYQGIPGTGTYFRDQLPASRNMQIENRCLSRIPPRGRSRRPSGLDYTLSDNTKPLVIAARPALPSRPDSAGNQTPARCSPPSRRSPPERRRLQPRSTA